MSHELIHFMRAGKRYVRCPRCLRVAPDKNWAHVCGDGGNWYDSVAELEAALNKTLPLGTIVRGTRPR